jgi:branched-chain amino acid transport system ATP-binding protein
MLEVRNVEVKYGAATALRGVSIDVAAGELVCVVGPNGAGKSTLINAIAGLHPVASGTMSLAARDLTRLAPHRFCAEGIAIVPEGPAPLHRHERSREPDAGELHPEGAGSTRRVARSRVCAFSCADEKLDAPAGALSGGQQQMVALARALMAQPQLLLLDEPSLGLSPLIVQSMFAMIERIPSRRCRRAFWWSRMSRWRSGSRRGPMCSRKDDRRRATRPKRCVSSRTSGRAYLGMTDATS